VKIREESEEVAGERKNIRKYEVCLGRYLSKSFYGDCSYFKLFY
jgi:hypothetical protein